MFKKLHYLDQLPPALGPQLTAESLSITFASDAPGLPITLTNDTNYGVVGANTLRTAAQIGNATGAAAFGTGTRSAQVLRVTIATDDLVPVTVSSSALPTGAATEAKQDTGNASLSSIDTKLTSPLTVAATNLDIRDLTSVSDSVSAVQSGTWSVDVDSLPLPADAATETTLSALNAKFGSLGQKNMAGSAPVVIASDQSVLTVAQNATFNVAVVGTASVDAVNLPDTVQVNYGAPDSSSLRVAAMLGVGSTAVSNANPVPISDAGGTITVDGTVAVSSIPTASLSNIAYQAKGRIAGASLTGSYTTLLNPTSDLRIIYIFNSCDQTILVSLDGGTTDTFQLEGGEGCSVDLGTSGLKFDNTVNISAKHDGVVPTAGSVRATGLG